MPFRYIYFSILFLLIFRASGLSQDSLDVQLVEERVPKSLQLSHIEIQEQFIDFKKLADPRYRESLEFGNVLNQSFDSLAAHYNYPLNLKLPHYLNDLTFHFSAIEWEAPHKIEYSYVMEGFNGDWSPPSDHSKITFRDLPPGTYVLKIKAKGETQIWSAPFTYTFQIRIPWWRSRLAFGLYYLLFAAIVITIFRYRQERLDQEAEIRSLLAAYQTTDFPTILLQKEVPRESSFLNLVQTTLERHLSDENFGIAELCELLNISRAQLHRKIKKLTGLSTSHYIRSLRLEIAEELLESSDLNVSEVAFKVGFSSPSYFSKVFKAQFGYPPRELR